MIVWDLVYSFSEPDFWVSIFPTKLSHDFELRGMSILQYFQRAIFPYWLRLESRGWVCW